MTHVRVNRSGRLRDHIKNMHPKSGDKLLVGMSYPLVRKALYSLGLNGTVSPQKNGRSIRTVKRDDGKMVPVMLVTFL